ncbi:MAG: DUF1320 domain-containing protein [Pseudomonadota bacterium]
MAYCTQTDIEEQLTPDGLAQLSDDADLGEADASVMARAIEDADARIDSYCVNRYSVPFSPVPVLVRKISVDLAIYDLMSRRFNEVPEERRRRFTDAISFLKDVGAGKATLGADATPTNTGQTVETVLPTRRFTRDKLGGLL